MSGQVEHQRAVALLVKRADFDDVEPAVSEENRGAAPQPAGFRRIQHLYAYALTDRRTLRFWNRANGNDAAGTRPSVCECRPSEEQHTEYARTNQDCPSHRSAFHISTVSGKSECPSCKDHSRRARTT